MNKKIFLPILLAFAIALFGIYPQGNAMAESLEYKVIYPEIYIFSAPDASAKIIDGENNAIMLSYGEIVTKISTKTGTDGLLYMQIEPPKENLLGEIYVLESNVLSCSISSPQKDLDANARTNAESLTYKKNGEQFEPLGITLAKGQQIRLIDGYDKSEPYCKIQYKNNDGDLVYAYIKTSTVSVSRISSGTISAVIIIVTTISLSLLIFGIGRKNKNKTK